MLRLTIISILLSSLGFSQNEEIKIAKVEVKGHKVTSKKTIIFTAGLREGQTITTADFPRAIKRLWQLNLFQDIQIHFNEETKEGLSITIEVKENFVLGKINYNGNKKVKDRKLNEEVELSTGQRIKPNTIYNTKELIRDIYAEKGSQDCKTPFIAASIASLWFTSSTYSLLILSKTSLNKSIFL